MRKVVRTRSSNAPREVIHGSASVLTVLALLLITLTGLEAYGQLDPCAPHRDPSEPFSETSVSERDGFLLAEPFRIDLLLMRNHPELIDQYDEALAQRLLAEEKRLRLEADAMAKYPPLEPPFNTANPVFAFQWSELNKDQAAEVYLRRNYQWPFLSKTPGWNLNDSVAWVGMFLFPKSLEVDRDPTAVAREAALLLKEQLIVASKLEPASLWFPILISPSDYNFDPSTRTLHFKTDILPQSRNVPSPQGPQQWENYGVSVEQGSEDEQWRAGTFRTDFTELETWRQMVGFYAKAEDMALDRELRINDIQLNGLFADVRSFTAANGFLKLRLFLSLTDSEAERGSKDQFIFHARVKKIDVVDDHNHVVSTVPASSLPTPGALLPLSPQLVHGGVFSEKAKLRNCRNIHANVDRSMRAAAAQAQVRKEQRQESDAARQSPPPLASAALPKLTSSDAPHLDKIRGNLLQIRTKREPGATPQAGTVPDCVEDGEDMTPEEVGTGFVISSNLGTVQIITAAHVVCNAASITVDFGDDPTRPIAAKVLFHNKPLDLAVLEIHVSPLLRTLKQIQPMTWLPRSSLTVPMKIWLVDSSGEPDENRVARTSDRDGDVTRFEYSVKSSGQGYSGGPILDDHGRLVGIHLRARPKSDYERGLGVHIELALAALEAQGYRLLSTNQLIKESSASQ